MKSFKKYKIELTVEGNKLESYAECPEMEKDMAIEILKNDMVLSFLKAFDHKIIFTEDNIDDKS